jgi:O-antigen/teichoic acid export membrane protein
MSGLRERRSAPAPDHDGGGAPAIRPTARTGRVDAAASVAGTLVVQASGFLAGLLVVHSLGAEARGVMALVALTYRQAAVIASVGLDSALLHFGARAPNELRLRARRSLVIGLGQGALAALVGWILLKTVLAGSVSPAAGAVAIAALASPSILVLNYGTAALRGAGRLVEASVLEVVAATTTLAVVVAGVAFGSLWLAVVGAAAGAALGAAVTALMVERLPEPAGAPGPPEWGRLVRYGLAGHVGTVFQNLNYRVDFYLVALLLTTTDVGVYALAVSLAEALLLLPDALAAVVMQRAAASSRVRATEVTLRLGLAAGLVGGVILAVASRRLVPAFFGSQFAAAPDAILALLPGILSLAVWKTLMSDLAGRGHPLVKSTSAAVALVATVVGDLVLIPRFGIVGAAAASSVAYAAAAVVVVRRYRLVMDRSLATIVLGR